MDFALSSRAAAFRDEVRAFLEAHLTADVVDAMHRTGTFNDKDLNGALAEAPVERLAHDGPLIEERYEVDAAGVIAVTIAAVEDGYAQRFVL